MNAEGYGIYKQIRREAKEIQNELTNISWTAGLVIRLRAWKKLISRMLRCGGRARPRGFGWWQREIARPKWLVAYRRIAWPRARKVGRRVHGKISEAAETFC